MVELVTGKPLKLMFLIDSYVDPYAGTEKQLYSLVEGLDRKLIEPHLTLLRPSSYIEKNGFPCDVTLLPINKIMKPSSFLDILRYGYRLRKLGFRLVHIFFVDASIIAPFPLRLFGIKVIISRRDLGYWYNRKNLIPLRLNALVINSVITNSLAVKQITHDIEHVPLHKIKVIYNGFKETQPPENNTQSATSVYSQSGYVVGIVANIRPVKRIDDLIKAFKIVHQKLKIVKLLVIGSGDSRYLQDLAIKLEIADAIEFLGKQTNTLKFIKDFDVGVSCSESEGLSNSIIEYMYHGVPVVATRTGGNVELVRDGITGYLVEVGDYSMLAEKIILLLEDPALARRIRYSAADQVRKLCSMETMITEHTKIYAEILALGI